jgi:serine/threonine-protein kinase
MTGRAEVDHQRVDRAGQPPLGRRSGHNRHGGRDERYIVGQGQSVTDEGLRAAAVIRERHPKTAVLLLSSYLEARYAEALLKDHPAGSGYLLKDRVYDAAAVGDALRRVSIGECVIDPEIISQLLRRGRERNPLDALTDREREILSLMAQGYSNDSICNQLFISRRTVESHVSSVFAKLGIVESPESSRRVLAVLTYLQG